MSKSVLVTDTPENCYDCTFGTAYCNELEYVGYCELANCLDYDVILMEKDILFSVLMKIYFRIETQTLSMI